MFSGNGGQVITSTHPETGEITHQIIQTVTDPKTGQVKQITMPLSNGTHEHSTTTPLGQVVTTIDPVTGEHIQKIVQSFTDPKTGEVRQISVPFPSSTQKGIRLLTSF